jgi:hypothetical protein
VETTTTTMETWFIPLDILLIMCTTSAIGLAMIFLFAIIFDKTCHTVPMMLVANVCLTGLVLGMDTLWMGIFTLQNDPKKI